MIDLSTQQVDEAKRWKILTDFWVSEICGLRKDKPDAVVFRPFWTVAQHEHDLLAKIDCEA